MEDDNHKGIVKNEVNLAGEGVVNNVKMDGVMASLVDVKSKVLKTSCVGLIPVTKSLFHCNVVCIIEDLKIQHSCRACLPCRSYIQSIGINVSLV